MSARHKPAVLLQRDEISLPPVLGACHDQNFGMPPAVYGAMAAFLFGFMAILAAGLAHPELIVPMGINFFFLAAFFAVPTIFVRAAPAGGSRAMRWSEFVRNGIDTETGRTSAAEAVTLALMLPFLIFCWAIAIVVIASPS